MVEENMKKLVDRVLKYSNHVEKMILGSFEGLFQKDQVLLERIIGSDEHHANKVELNIENHCITFIARFAPKAIALRTVISIIKMNNDLERMADHAVNISKSALYLLKHGIIPTTNTDDLQFMLQETVKMLNNCIDSLVMQNTSISKEVIDSDRKINALKAKIRDEQIMLMIEDKTMIKPTMKILNIVRNLERIADLTTNIAEDVIYMYDGIMVKRNKTDEEEISL